MKQFRLIGLVLTVVSAIFFNTCVSQQDRTQSASEPAWVRQRPENIANTAYFVGKSEPRGNYENYQEARGSALMDALTQCVLYQGAKVNDTIITENTQADVIQETTIGITFNGIFSDGSFFGLYRQGEWIARDGTVYALYAYALVGNTNPSPDIPEFFQSYNLRDDKVYFIGKSSAPDNNQESLSTQAAEDAKLHVLLWRGGKLSSSLGDYSKATTSEDGIGISRFTANAKFTSQITIQSLSFQEETRYVQQEGDQQYHYYGLYSINDEKPKTGAEQEYFSYQLESSESDSKAFSKRITINGRHFNQNRPYTAQFAAYPKGRGRDVPQWVKDVLKVVPEDDLFGIGASKHGSVDAMNLMAATWAVAEIARQMNSSVIYSDDYSAGRSISSTTISHVIKEHRYDPKIYDTDWQIWTLSAEDAQRIKEWAEMKSSINDVIFDSE